MVKEQVLSLSTTLPVVEVKVDYLIAIMTAKLLTALMLRMPASDAVEDVSQHQYTLIGSWRAQVPNTDCIVLYETIWGENLCEFVV